MQTRDKNSIESQQDTHSVEPRKLRRWLAGLSAGLVVLLMVGASIFVFAEAKQRQGSQQPPRGQWQQVQSGYLFLSLQGAPSNPSVLYACATTSAAVSNKEGQAATILRSTDAGDHWQNVGASAGLGSLCELAVSPTNENDIYVISSGTTSQTNATLRHSADGGQMWTTIRPAFSPPVTVPGINQPLPWLVQQLRYDGHNLYGIQWIATRAPDIQGPPTAFNRLPRLVTSANGGRTWRIIDGQFTAQNLGAQFYTLDVTHPGTVYEIVGQTAFPVETAPVPTTRVLPRFGLNEQLVKSTDGGANWQSLLNGLPYGSQVQLASANPQIVYAGGIRGPLPLVPGYQPNQWPIVPGQPEVIVPGVFNLQVSTNGGASWQQVASPPGEQLIQGWFVSADGSVYTSPTISSASPGVGPSVVPGTAIPGTVVPATPVYGTPLPARTAPGGLPDIQTTLPVSHPDIERYDLASHTWSNVTIPPISGHLLAVTSSGTNGGSFLWYVGLQGTQYALYRYGV